MNNADAFSAAAAVLDGLPDWLEAYRRRRGLSLREAAEEIGLSYVSVNRIEAGTPCSVYSARLIIRWLIRQAA